MSDTGERGGIRQRIVDDYAGRKLFDERGEKLGKVEYTVLDTEGKPEYLAVKTGWFGSNTTLLPEGIVRPGERDDEFAVQASQGRIKDAPTFGDEDDVTPDFEDRVRSHFGMGIGGESSGESSGGAGAAGAGAGAAAASSSGESRDRGTSDDSRERGSSDEGRSRDDDRASGESRDHESRGEERGDDRGSGESRDRDERSAESRSGSGDRGTEDRGAGGIARDTDRGERRDDRGSSGSGGGREKVRVTVKREKARAERIRGEDGKEEVRIRKEMIEEEEMVEVEDRLS